MTDTAHARARNTDPAPSHIAARQIELFGTAQKQRITALQWVHKIPGSTSMELAGLMGGDDLTVQLNYRMLGRRLPELRENGTIENRELRKCAVTGRWSLTWFPRKPMTRQEFLTLTLETQHD